MAGGDVAFGLSWKEFSQQSLESVDRLDSATGECFAAVGEHPKRLELAVDLQHPQSGRAHRNHRDRVSVQRVGLAVVAGIEESNAGSELGRHVDDLLTSLQ